MSGPGSGGGGGGKGPGGDAGGQGKGHGGRRETVYSDRFLPSRSGSAGLRGFNLLDCAQPPASASHPSSEREVRRSSPPAPHSSSHSRPCLIVPTQPDAPRHALPRPPAIGRFSFSFFLLLTFISPRLFPSLHQDTSAAYSTLLRSELLGDASASAVGLSPARTSPGMEGARQYSHSRCVGCLPATRTPVFFPVYSELIPGRKEAQRSLHSRLPPLPVLASFPQSEPEFIPLQERRCLGPGHPSRVALLPVPRGWRRAAGHRARLAPSLPAQNRPLSVQGA